MGQAKPVILLVEDDALLRMVAADTLEAALASSKQRTPTLR
jgi:hypothetical protein